MKTTFLKLGILLTMSIIVAGFTSCNGDEPMPMPSENSVIVATNVVGNTSEIVSVRKQQCRSSGWGGGCTMIAETSFQNNGFTMQLPETLSNDFLTHISNGLVPFEGNFSYFTVTGNIETRWLSPLGWWESTTLTALDKDGVSIGRIAFGRDIQNYNDNIFAFWTYVTDDVIIIGEAEVCHQAIPNSICFRRKANLSLNKGWNLIYVHRLTVTENDIVNVITTFTSQRPSGEFSWTFTSFGN